MTPTLLGRAHAALGAARIPAALIGAAALAVHGASRSTVDQDLLVVDVRALDHDVWRALSGIASIDVRRGDADDPLAGVVRITADAEREVDVVVGRHEWQRQVVQEASASPAAVGGESIPVASPAGLVLLKLYAGGPQDLWDIEQLRAIFGSDLDEAVTRRVQVGPSDHHSIYRFRYENHALCAQ